MSTVEFVQDALQSRIAPKGSGESVKDRIRIAAKALGWSFTRTKDAWYADPRISINGDELSDVEELAGVRYGRKEVTEINGLISKATALLEGEDENITGPVIAAFRAFLSALDRPGTPRD